MLGTGLKMALSSVAKNLASLSYYQVVAHVFLLLPVVCSPAWAEEEPGKIEVLIVEAEAQQQSDELGLSQINISGDELTFKIGATLGETLANEIGVHNASYGPGVGLPVLRGLSGVRVHLSEDGIGAWDASSLSPDHATAIEAVIADNIQVVKGPATVLYGNNAIGGIVEVNNGRLPDTLKGQMFSTRLETRKELVNDHGRESYAGKIRTEFGPMVLHADGFVREAKDMSIPGLAIQEDEIEQLYGIPEIDNTFGTVLNTDSDSNSVSHGVSFVFDNFYFGYATTYLENDYGIPPGSHTEPADSPGHSHSHPVGDTIAAQPRVRIDLEQTRRLYKIGGRFDNPYFKTLDIVGGDIAYEHREFEQAALTGEIFGGTQFTNDVVEAKVELGHTLFGFLNEAHSGTWGVQWIMRDFAAKSETLAVREDYVPETGLRSVGLFVYEKFPFSKGVFEFGGRYGWQKITQHERTAPILPEGTQFFHEPLSYRNYTYSAALSFDYSPEHRFSFNMSAAQRAPEIQELLSVGAHLATRSYDVGLLIQTREEPPEAEQFYGAEFRWEWFSRIGELTTELFYTRANNFVYQARSTQLFDISAGILRNSSCVRLAECISVFNYRQGDVDLSGYEVQWFLPKYPLWRGQFQAELFADYVRAEFVQGGDLPRIPPRRQGIGGTWELAGFSSSVRYSYVSKQNRIGENEIPTDAYHLLNARFAYSLDFPDSDQHGAMVFLQMKNVLDEEIRKSTTFLRNFSPEPGREISLGVRYDF